MDLIPLHGVAHYCLKMMFCLSCGHMIALVSWRIDLSYHLISSHFISVGRRGTTNDVKTISFHLSLCSAALMESLNLIHVHFSSSLLSFSPPCSFHCSLQNCRRHARGSWEALCILWGEVLSRVLGWRGVNIWSGKWTGLVWNGSNSTLGLGLGHARLTCSDVPLHFMM